MAKKFFYVCAGVFLLALSYHLGASSVSAQATGSVVGYAPWNGQGREFTYVTTDGSVFYRDLRGGTVLLGQLFGGTTNTTQESWGQLKDRFK